MKMFIWEKFKRVIYLFLKNQIYFEKSLILLFIIPC